MQLHLIQSKVNANLRNFQRMVNHAVTATPVQRRILLCSQSMLYAIHNHCGLYNSKKLEDCLTHIAQTHHRPLAATFQKKSVLHVMSRAYASGGHTRVVERWLNAAPTDEKHDVVLLSQGNRPLPTSLHKAIRLDTDFPLEKALNLRVLASGYQYIVLHTHMHDPVPTLAFGTTDFKRPVVFYNHADHLPWFGCAITDLAVNLRSHTVEINRDFRGITDTLVLPLPVDQPPATLPNKAKAKAALGLSPQSKVIISLASAYKYKAMEGIDFIDTLEKILHASPNAVALIIGPSPTEPEWNAAIQRSGNRIRVLGIIPYSQLGTYLSAADLALESFPLGSTTGLLDIARYNIPCLSLETPTNGYDAFTKAGIAFPTTSKIATEAIKQLSAPTPNKLYKIVKDESFPQSFSKKLQLLSQRIPARHVVHTVHQSDSRLTPFSTIQAAHNFKEQHTPKRRLMRLARRLIYLYTKNLYPFGLTKRLYCKLDSYSLL